MTDRPGSFLCKNIPPSFFWKFYLPTNEVKNLSVTVNPGNPFASHITKVCHACYYHLKDFRWICKIVSVETVALLANSMISSRIEYCNSLLYGVNKYNVAKLQKIQNALCRIVFKLDKTSHVTSYLQKLHWLPISNLILFKYNLITFKATKFSQPTYLTSLIKTGILTHAWKSAFSFFSSSKEGYWQVKFWNGF